MRENGSQNRGRLTKKPETLTIDQANRLIAKLSEHTRTRASRLKAIRNKTIALLMLDAGLRCGEVIACSVGDLSFNGGPVSQIILNKEIAKKAGTRSVPVSPRLHTQLVLMLTSWWILPNFSPASAAFWTCPDGYRLSVRQVQRIISQAAREIFGHTVNPHMLRHTFASNLMRKTNIRVVQTLLGHKCLSSTQIYTHPDAEDLRTAINSLPD